MIDSSADEIRTTPVANVEGCTVVLVHVTRDDWLALIPGFRGSCTLSPPRWKPSQRAEWLLRRL